MGKGGQAPQGEPELEFELKRELLLYRNSVEVFLMIGAISYAVVLLCLPGATATCSGVCWEGTCYDGKVVDPTGTCTQSSGAGKDVDSGKDAVSESPKGADSPTGVPGSVPSGRPKVLCLHGGGGNGAGFEQYGGVVDIMASLGDTYEFFFPSAPDGMWVRDPPGGKGQPTTDPDFASASVDYLDEYVQTHGPFAGILGYSQGAMFTAFYLSVTPTPFDFALMFCGYLPTTHQGLLGTITAQSPFNNIPALSFMGANDNIITNEMSTAQAALFASPVVLSSSVAGHEVPGSSDPQFSAVIAFLTEHVPFDDNTTGGTGTSFAADDTPTDTPTNIPTDTPTHIPTDTPTPHPAAADATPTQSPATAPTQSPATTPTQPAATTPTAADITPTAHGDDAPNAVANDSPTASGTPGDGPEYSSSQTRDCLLSFALTAVTGFFVYG